MARMKKEVVTCVTGEEMEQAFSDYAIADARIQRINAKADEEITRIRDRYADDLKKNTDLRARSFDVLQTYALENREELFSKKKSMELAHGTFGFRLGTPSIKQVKGYKVDVSLKLAQTFAPDFIRVKEELDKALLLNRRDEDGMIAVMEKIGVYVDQAETFFVEPKKEGEDV